ncbi:helix-turn-helix domain-containing protein [Bacillus sp. UNC322MFChir4.1]|uniref:helix-turn-helix domain-containing protein n=2 Tax=Bacillus TaxID=1386 RepID=UPI00068AC476|nr:MerR family transcriptional regulator [Bacillus sp. UNC322MFChir4.1]
MKGTITINQLARIFDISHHQIRYYEEKGLLFPSYVDKNKYRKYALKEIYQLAQILMLRNLNISINQIKDMFKTYQKREYLNLLKEKSNEIIDEIKRLTEIQKSIEYHMNNLTKEKIDSTKYVENIHLKKIITLRADENLTAKDVYEMKLSTLLLGNDIFYVFEEDTYHLCIKTDGNTDFVMKEGLYKSLYIHGGTDEEFEERLLTIIAKENFPIYAIEYSNEIFISGDILELEILMPAKGDEDDN